MSLDISLTRVQETEVFEYNITHNLGEMASMCLALDTTLYMVLWRPDELNIKDAKELIPYFEDALPRLKKNPPAFEVFNAPNGWGKYENLVEFVEKYLAACKEYPDARVHTWR